MRGGSVETGVRRGDRVRVEFDAVATRKIGSNWDDAIRVTINIPGSRVKWWAVVPAGCVKRAK